MLDPARLNNINPEEAIDEICYVEIISSNLKISVDGIE